MPRRSPTLVEFALALTLGALLMLGPMAAGAADDGTLQLCSGGACNPAPCLATDIDITVTGPIARTRVT